MRVDLRRVIERLRISMFRVRTLYSRQRETLGLTARSLYPVLIGTVLLVGSLLLDEYLLPAIGVAVPGGAVSRLTPVLTTVAGLTGLIALAVTVSTGPLQSALARFPGDVGAPLVEDEPRDGLLALVIATFTLALGSLMVSVFVGLAPVTGTLLVASLAMATLATLVGYVKQRVVLFDPANLARYLAWQMGRWAEAASPKPQEDPGPSVTSFLRHRHLSNFDRLVSMCRSLLDAGHHEEAREVLRTLTAAVCAYIARRRRLNPRGEWFPMREVAVHGYDDVVSPMYEHLALGQARRTERDAHWFERRTGHAWTELIETAAANEAAAFAVAWLSSVEDLMRSAYTQQEFELLDRTLAAFEEAVPALIQLQVLDSAANLPLELSELLDRPGFALELAEAALEKNPALGAKGVWDAGLPTVFTEAVLDLGGRLRNEVDIAGRRVTPRQQVRRELMNRLAKRKTEVEERYASKSADALSSILDAAARQEITSTRTAAAGVGLLMADRQLLRGRIEMAQRVAKLSCSHLEETTLAAIGDRERRAVVEQLRRLVLRAMVARSIPVVEAGMPLLVVGLIHDLGSDQRLLRHLLAIAGLARLASELDGEPRYERAVVVGLDAARVDKERLAETLLTAASTRVVHRFLPVHVAERYRPYLSAFSEKIERLPTKRVKEPWAAVYDLVPDHPSELVKEVARGAMTGTDLDECVASFLRTLLPPGEGEDRSDG
jgi:hypothetical protein